jgi:dipeptidyl aminopeptidase/acylaminoacyl peptidase
VDPKGGPREKDEEAGRDAIVADQGLRPRRLHVLDVATRKAEPWASLGELSAWDFAWSRDAKALVASVTTAFRNRKATSSTPRYAGRRSRSSTSSTREPHGFRERWHRLDALTRSVAWIDKYLGEH